MIHLRAKKAERLVRLAISAGIKPEIAYISKGKSGFAKVLVRILANPERAMAYRRLLYEAAIARNHVFELQARRRNSLP